MFETPCVGTLLGHAPLQLDRGSFEGVGIRGGPPPDSYASRIQTFASGVGFAGWNCPCLERIVSEHCWDMPPFSSIEVVLKV